MIATGVRPDLRDVYRDIAVDPQPYIMAAARARLIPFTRRMFPRYEAARHHYLIADALEAVERGALDRVILTLPPRHGKSELASVHYPAWYLGRNPDHRVITTSYSASLAHRFSRRSRSLLTEPTWPFPDVQPAPDWKSVSAWDLDGYRGGYIAAGVGGGITGHGADLFIIDDPVKSADEADSVTYRERTWEWYTETAVTRLEPAGKMVVIGTRWHEDDLIGRILASATGNQWTLLHMPAIDEDGHALWPERYGVDDLLRIRAQVGPRAWHAQYQGSPSPAEGGMFPAAWWRRYTIAPTLRRIELFVDSAFKEGVQNDYSVIATWGSTGEGDYYLLDLWRGRVAFPELLRACHDQWVKQRARFGFTCKALVIEDKASGQSAVQTLARPMYTESGMLSALPVIAYKLPAGQSKVARADGVTGMVESRHCFLPDDAAWVSDFIDEHQRFPTGVHDDQVDTTSMALTRLGIQRPGRIRSY